MSHFQLSGWSLAIKTFLFGKSFWFCIPFLVMLSSEVLATPIWSSPCAKRFNQRMPEAAGSKSQLTCVNTVGELAEKAFTDGNFAYTKLALTGVKYLNIDPDLVLGDSSAPAETGAAEKKSAPAKSPIQLKFKKGFILDPCSMAFGSYRNFLFDWYFCNGTRGYSHYKPNLQSEGIAEGKYRGKNTFVSNFQGHRAPVSLCIQERTSKMLGGIAPGPVLIAVYDLEGFSQKPRVGGCFFLVTGPVEKKNWLSQPEGTIMQAGIFPEHPDPRLRNQEVIKLYPDVPAVKLKKPM